MTLNPSFLLAVLLACLPLAGCGEPALPAAVPVSLAQPGELARMTFESTHRHGYGVGFRLRYPTAAAGAPSDVVALRREDLALSVHFTLRRTDAAGSRVVFDGDREAQPMGFGADWFDRDVAGRFVLEPGHYEAVVTLLKPQPGFAAYPTTLKVYSDRGFALYKD